MAKVSCILCHRGVQLILAYSWARPVILVAGKGRGGMFLFLLFLPFHSCSSFFPVHLFHFLYYLFSPFLWETTQNDPQGLTCCQPQHNQKLQIRADIHIIFFLLVHKNIYCGYSLEVPQSHKNIYCGYSLEVPLWGTSYEYPQYMFLWRSKKNINTFLLKKKHLILSSDS